MINVYRGFKKFDVCKVFMQKMYLYKQCIGIKVFKNVKIKKIIGLYYNSKVIKDLL